MYRIADGRWMQTKINRTRHGGLVAVRTDITRLRDVEASLKAALAEEQLVLDTATVGIAFLKDRKIVKCNRQMEAMLGYGHGALIGQSSAVYFPSVEAWERVGEEVYSAMERGEHGELDLELMRKDGTRLWCHAAGRPLEPGNPGKGAIWVYSDITERRRHEELNRELADQDVLTGLANRRVLDDRLSQAIAQGLRAGAKVVLMLVDLDRFKAINDRYGHYVGDQVLKTVASRLRGCVRAADTTARTGGDEFVIVLSAVGESREAARVADSALAALARPIAVDGIEHVLSASIGVSVFPDDGDDPKALLRLADQAMYAVKESGGNGYRFHCHSRVSAESTDPDHS
jgi:diguanylate cyclase (GGDEF)-like protein/PAS domain S-box-containing protein